MDKNVIKATGNATNDTHEHHGHYETGSWLAAGERRRRRGESGNGMNMDLSGALERQPLKQSRDRGIWWVVAFV